MMSRTMGYGMVINPYTGSFNIFFGLIIIPCEYNEAVHEAYISTSIEKK